MKSSVNVEPGKKEYWDEPSIDVDYLLHIISSLSEHLENP